MLLKNADLITLITLADETDCLESQEHILRNHASKCEIFNYKCSYHYHWA